MASTAVPAPPEEGTKARRTHDALLDAMERLLDHGGYPAATSTAVAEEAGVSVGTFYAYFPDRDGALASLLADRLDTLLRQVDGALTTDALLDDGLETVLDAALDAVLATYGRHAATFRAALSQLPSSDAIRATYWDRHRRSVDVVTTFLRRGQSAGQVRDGDAEVLALSLLVMVQATNSPILLAKPRSRGARAVRDEIARALVALLSPA